MFFIVNVTSFLLYLFQGDKDRERVQPSLQRPFHRLQVEDSQALIPPPRCERVHAEVDGEQHCHLEPTTQ